MHLKQILYIVILFIMQSCLATLEHDNPVDPLFNGEYQIKSRGPAGGWIFYDKGYYSDGWRYLEAAPADVSGTYQWGIYGKPVAGADNTIIGKGKQNTMDIIDQYPSNIYAAHKCDNYELNGYDDWFLPSIDELTAIYNKLNYFPSVDGALINDRFYCSSSEYNDSMIYIRIPASDLFKDKNQNFHIRPIRAF